MLRRLTAIIVLWVSLLGAALPTCASAMSSCDCCDHAGAAIPCTGDGAFAARLDVTSKQCCATGQPGFPAAAMDSNRTSDERAQVPSSPDPLVLVAWSASWAAPFTTPPIIPWHRVRSPSRSAVPTYLYTARLRL